MPRSTLFAALFRLGLPLTLAACGGGGAAAPGSTLVFSSGCDLFRTNPSSSQIFAVRPDGSGLRQLTTLRGTFTDAEGAFHAELPGPLAYGPYAPGGTVLP